MAAPITLKMAPSTVAARLASGDLKDATVAEILTLIGVEAGATADQTGAEIKSLYEVESNAYTDTKNTKLAGIEAGAKANFLQQGTGAVSRTIVNKLEDSFSVKDFGVTGDGVTDDGATIALAITAAIAAGNTLFWADGTYLTTASIASLHSVRHLGPGIIKRGVNTFPVEPTQSTTNILFVEQSGGSDINDGISANEPFAKGQAAFDVLPNYGPVLNGRWRIQFGAGTWTDSDGVVMEVGLTSKRGLEVFGVSVSGATPTTIFDGTSASVLGSAFSFQENNNVHVRDVKGVNWTLSSVLSTTVSMQDFCNVFTENVHATGNGSGIGAGNGGRLRVKGGIIDSCINGINCNNNITFTIGQSATMLSEGPIIKNCTGDGIVINEFSSGHVDWTTLDNNNRGLNILEGGRVHLQGSDVKNNILGARMAEGGYLFENTTNTNNWNEGTGDANTTKWQQQSFSGDSALTSVAQSEIRVGSDLTIFTHTGTTAKTVIATPFTIPNNFFVAENRRLKVLVHGQYTTNTGVIDIGVDFAGNVMEQLRALGTPTGGIAFIAEFNIWATGGSAQALSSILLHFSGQVRTLNRVRAVVMTSGAKALQITVQQSVSGDTTTVNKIEVWLTG